MKQNIFTKQFGELTADELLHLMDMLQEECVNMHNCANCKLLLTCCSELGKKEPADWDTMSIKNVVEKFREENR